MDGNVVQYQELPDSEGFYAIGGSRNHPPIVDVEMNQLFTASQGGSRLMDSSLSQPLRPASSSSDFQLLLKLVVSQWSPSWSPAWEEDPLTLFLPPTVMLKR